MPNDKKPNQTLKIYIPEHLKGGVFSNIANIHISKNEVIIDFLFRSPGEIRVVSRVILPIEHAESLQKVLSDLLKKRK